MNARTHRCTCSSVVVIDECQYVGPQEVGDGEWVMLHNCPNCKTTFAGATLRDAAKCSLCLHHIVGDADDPKIIVCAVDNEGPYTRIYCADCACTDPIARADEWVDNAVHGIRSKLGIDVDARRADRWAAAHPTPSRRSRSLAPAPLEMRAS